jgi:hypothetical protein
MQGSFALRPNYLDKGGPRGHILACTQGEQGIPQVALQASCGWSMLDSSAYLRSLKGLYH